MSELLVCATCFGEIALPPSDRAARISNPRCACGSETKKAYSKPVFRELSKAEAFLHIGLGRSKAPALKWELSQ
jgi:hypothetical protein